MSQKSSLDAPYLHLALSDVAQAVGARVVGGAASLLLWVQAVCSDSRQITPGCIFFALRGAHFDGHAFAAAAVEQGALALVADTAGAACLKLPSATPVLVVTDTQQALGDLSAWYRRQQTAVVAAVTGSNGKTTTKELLAAILACRGAVHKTPGNLNNLIGLPLTLMRWPKQAWATVLEMGMSVPGEIARLTQIAQPDVGLITCVAPAHLEGMGSLAAIARSKLELFAGLPAHATACLNADDAMLVQHSAGVLHNRRVLRFGTGADCDVRLADVQTHSEGLGFSLSWRGGPCLPVILPLVGRHNALNAAGAAAAATALGLTPKEIVAGLRHVVVPGARLRILRNTPRGVHIIDDSYNANPGSVEAALHTLADLSESSSGNIRSSSGHGRRFVVLGDMLELGDAAPALHSAVGRQAAALGVSKIFALGQWAPYTVQAACDAGCEAEAFVDIAALQAAVGATLKPGDWLLVKGSRGMRMERLVSTMLKGEI